MFYRFLLVGVINTGVGLSLIFLFMNGFHLNYWISTFIGNSIGAVISFLLNRSFTFNSSISYHKGLIRFIAVIFICYILSYGLSYLLSLLLTDDIHLFFMIFSKDDLSVLGGTLFYTLTNYTGQKYFVFPEGNHSNEALS